MASRKQPERNEDPQEILIEGEAYVELGTKESPTLSMMTLCAILILIIIHNRGRLTSCSKMRPTQNLSCIQENKTLTPRYSTTSRNPTRTMSQQN
jgi:hypothetical protein